MRTIFHRLQKISGILQNNEKLSENVKNKEVVDL